MELKLIESDLVLVQHHAQLLDLLIRDLLACTRIQVKLACAFRGQSSTQRSRRARRHGSRFGLTVVLDVELLQPDAQLLRRDLAVAVLSITIQVPD